MERFVSGMSLAKSRRCSSSQRQSERNDRVRTVLTSRITRFAKLTALAIHLDQLFVMAGEESSGTNRLANVSRHRLTQILSLLTFAPDSQEAILLLDPTTSGRDAVQERDLRRLMGSTDWQEQRAGWTTMPKQYNVTV